MPKEHVRANTPALPIISRRSMLAAPLVLLPSTASSKGGESPILRLFREYYRLIPRVPDNPSILLTFRW